MIEYIFKSNILAVIIILNYFNMSYYFSNKYIRKTDWSEVFKNPEEHKDIIPFIKKHFKVEYFMNEYLFFIANWNYEFIRVLLERGIDFYENCNVLTFTENGHLKVIKLLLGNGGYDDRIHLDYFLMRASAYGHLKVVKLLLENGANVCVLIITKL